MPTTHTTRRPIWHPQHGGYHYGVPGQPPRCGSIAALPVHEATYVHTERHGWQYCCNVCAAAVVGKGKR